MSDLCESSNCGQLLQSPLTGMCGAFSAKSVTGKQSKTSWTTKPAKKSVLGLDEATEGESLQLIGLEHRNHLLYN